MREYFLNYLVVFILLGCGCSTEEPLFSNAGRASFDAENYIDRIIKSSDSPSCNGVVPPEIVQARDELDSAIESAETSELENNETTTFAISTVKLCSSSLRPDQVHYLPSNNDFEGFFYLGSTAEKTKWYWVFIFANQNDITLDLMGDKNLFEVEKGGEIIVPLNLPRENPSNATVISVMTIDATILDNQFNSDSYHTSIRVYPDAQNFTSFGLNEPVVGNVSNFDPFPELVAYDEIDNETHLIFTNPSVDDRITIDFAVFDIVEGRTAQLDCGGDTKDLISVRDSGASATSVACVVNDDLLLSRDAIVSYRYDLFQHTGFAVFGSYTRAILGVNFER